jgi:membrane protein
MTRPRRAGTVVVHPQGTTESKSAHARAVARGFAQRLESTPIGVLWSRLLEVEFVDRSVALAAKLFVSLFPLLIVAAAVARAGVHQAIVAVVMDRLGVSGEALDMVQQAFASPEATKAATGILGVLLALAVSFTTALQRVYLRAWRRPPGGGMRNKGRGALWVGGVLVYIFLLAAVRDLIGGTTGTASAWLLSALAGTLLWWWTARLMLRGEVRWRPLLPTAALTGLGTSFYAMAADVWMPVTVSGNFAQFGAFGIALSFVTFFTGMAFVIVIGAVIGPVLAEADDPVGRWLRGRAATPLEPTAPPPLPGPDRPLRLADAFGRGARGSGVDPPAPDGSPGQ